MGLLQTIRKYLIVGYHYSENWMYFFQTIKNIGRNTIVILVQISRIHLIFEHYNVNLMWVYRNLRKYLPIYMGDFRTNESKITNKLKIPYFWTSLWSKMDVFFPKITKYMLIYYSDFGKNKSKSLTFWHDYGLNSKYFFQKSQIYIGLFFR